MMSSGRMPAVTGIPSGSRSAKPTGIVMLGAVKSDLEPPLMWPSRKFIAGVPTKAATVRFTGDKIVTTDKDKKDIYVATYTVDTSKTPHVIKMKSELPKGGGEVTGLIKREGDTVTLIYNVRGGPAPAGFKTTEGQNLFILKNLNKAAKD